MIHLLLVDDEPMAVDYLAEAIEESLSSLRLSRAYSGYQALELCADDRVDVLLTDIHMPGMSGITLADRMMERWPRCKIIFLTGYNDFRLIQQAIRRGSVDYVLKTEGDEPIFQALRKAIDDICSELQEEQILARAREQLQRATPFLRRDALTDLLHGERDTPEGRARRFAELGMALDPALPVYPLLGRIDDWGRYSSLADKSLMAYSVQNIAEELLTRAARFESAALDRQRFLWLVQPPPSAEAAPGDDEADAWEQTIRFARAMAGQVQTECRELLKLPVSLALGACACAFEELPRHYESLRLLLSSGVGDGRELLLVDGRTAAADKSSRAFFAESDLRAGLRRLEQLDAKLDSGDADGFERLFAELTRIDADTLGEARLKYMALETTSGLAAYFVAYLNRHGLMETLGVAAQLEAKLTLAQHRSLGDALDYFRRLGAQAAEHHRRRQQEWSHALVTRVHQYVHDYLHEELSLTRLSEVVHLSSPYLSRLYKQLTGHNLLDYITEARMSRAKQLLKESGLKIHAVAAAVGLESAPYFTRVFKKTTGLTPQEYRDRG